MAALEKARELMAAYDISEADLSHTQETESATVHRDRSADPYKIKASLAGKVARFCRCRGWRGSASAGYTFGFAGLESDVAFASWLLDTLADFVQRALRAHQNQRRSLGFACPRIVSASFVMGCAERIGERLRELSPPDDPTAPTGNAVVLSRKALIAQAMDDAGIRLRKHRSNRRVDLSAFGAGRSAGNAARFDKPVASGGTRRLT